MPYHVVDLVVKGLSRQGKPLTGARVLVLGVAFKADIGDARNSPAERVIELLQGRGADVRYHDPYVLAAADAVAIVTGHHDVDYARVLAHTSLVVDSCNVTHGLAGGATVIRLGAPLPQ